MNVFVLLESEQVSPIIVASDPLKVHAKSEFLPSGYGRSVLPDDAVLIGERKQKSIAGWGHREIAAEWKSPMFGTTFRLVAYSII